MPPAVVIQDHITPIKDILLSKDDGRDKQLHNLIHVLGKLNTKHFYGKFTVEQTVERLMEPIWFLQVRRYNPKEWITTANFVWRRATKILGDVDPPEIVLYPGFARCNGRVYKINRDPVIVCSPDFPRSTGKNLQVLLAHEYIHFARWRKTGISSENVPIYSQLFEEGLATWLSAKLLPELPLSKIFMSDLHRLIGRFDPKGGYLQWCRHNLAAITARTMNTLNSRESNDRGCLFEGARFGRKNTPIRAGYYLGYRIIDAMAKQIKLSELFILKPTIRDIAHWIECVIAGEHLTGGTTQ
jgi:hypothetical protein